MRAVSIVGIGSTTFGRHAGTPHRSAGGRRRRRRRSLDAGIDRQRHRRALSRQFHRRPADRPGGAGRAGRRPARPADDIPCTKVEGACASGGIAFRHAVAGGRHRACATPPSSVGVEKMTHASTARGHRRRSTAPWTTAATAPSGLTFPGLFGLAWRSPRAALRHHARARSSAVVHQEQGERAEESAGADGRRR